jgi:hypothetical protein
MAAAPDKGSQPPEASEPTPSQSEDLLSESDIFSPLKFTKNAVKLCIGNGSIVARKITDSNVTVFKNGFFSYLYHNGRRVKFVQCSGCKGIFSFTSAARYGTTGLTVHRDKCEPKSSQTRKCQLIIVST